MKASRSSRRDWRQSLPSGWIGIVKKPSFIGTLLAGMHAYAPGGGHLSRSYRLPRPIAIFRCQSCITGLISAKRAWATKRRGMDEIGASFRRRVPYEPIHRRRPLKLPGDARVAVWTIVNVENWSPAGPMPRAVLPPPMGQPLLPDLPNWAWHEYGMRVGFWRFIEVLGERGGLGVHGPRLRPAPDAQGRRPAPGDRRDDLGDQGFHRQAAAGLGEPGPNRDRRDHRPPRRSRHRIRRQLGARRAAGADPDASRRDRLGSLYGRDQRRRYQRRAAAALGRDPAPRPRPFRSPLPRRRHGAARDGDLDPPLPDRRAAPHQVPRGALRPHPRP